MFSPDMLTFQEFAMHETLPLAVLQNAVLEFLRGRDDVVVFGAQAVNAYVREPRMTQDIDLLSPRAADFAQELRDHLSERFHIAVCVREIGQGRRYRLYQIQKPENRHLVDVRPVAVSPETYRIADVLVIAPVDLIAAKMVAYHQRRGHPKSGTDWRDLAMLLITFPEFKQNPDRVTVRLHAMGAALQVVESWKEFAAQEISLPDDEDEF